MSDLIEPNTKFTPRINTSIEPQIDWAHGSVVLGRDRQSVTELGLKGTMCLGVICEHQSAGASLFGYRILFDNNFPHIIFICGKRGSGKSYTLGTIVEELGRSKSGIGTIVIDPLGTFWTMKNKNKSKSVEKILAQYGISPKNFDNIQVLTPTGFYEDLKSSVDGPFSIAVSELSVDDWGLVFDIDRFKTQGLLIGDVLDKIYNGYYAKVGEVTKKIPPKKKEYTIGDIIFCIKNDISINSASEGYAITTRRSVIARLKAAAKWGIFSVSGTPINEISVRNKITILDVSHSKLGSSRRALIVGILARKVLEARIESSRNEEVLRMGLKVKGKEIIPVTWLVIDEAHLLLPSSGTTPASQSLIEYAKLGRKPGCGLVFATQRPSATNDEILSQVDTIIGHNLALEDDIAALRRRIPAKMPSEFNTSDFIRGLPVGVCILADQKTQNRTMLVQIRPRMTHHSGKAAVPKTEEEQMNDDQAGIDVKDADVELEIQPEPELNPEMVGIASDQEDVMKISIDIAELDFTDDDKTNEIIDGEAEEVDQPPGRFDRSGLKQETTRDTPELIEKTRKTSETPLESGQVIQQQDYDITWGGAYIIISRDPDFGINIYGDYSKKSSGNTLCITRTHPSKLDNKILPSNIKQIWLSKSSEKNSVSPGNITKLAHNINEFLKDNKKGIILLDGLEYLVSNNDFPRILKFIESIHERIVLNDGVLLVPVNPGAVAKGNLEMLENEMANTITDPGLDFAKETKRKSEDIAKKEPSGIAGGTHTGSTIRTPTKEELRALCKKLGLKTTGAIDDLKKRLLDFEEGDLEPAKIKAKGDTGKRIQEQFVEPSEITAYEQMIFKELAKERKEIESLIVERKKLEDRVGKLRETERKHKMELEKQKLLDERKKLKLEKERLLAERKRLEEHIKKSGKKGTLGKPTVGILREIEKQPARRVGKGELESIPATRDLPTHMEPATSPMDFDHAISPGRAKKYDRVRAIRSKDKEPIGKAILVVKSRIKGEAIEEFAIKQLKTTLLGKPLEVIRNIQPVYLPLLRIYIKAVRGKIFAKEHGGKFYWDTVTGEIITDIGNFLKRSRGLSMLIKLSPNQAKVLAAMDSWGSNDVVDIQNEIHVPMNKIKSALTALKKKSLVSVEHHTEKRIDNYKRLVELKIPRKFDKIKIDMPAIIQSKQIDNIIEQQFKISDLKKTITNITPGTRIVNAEDVYYPYFKIDIISKSGPRLVLLDAVTGANDKILTEIIQFQK